MKRDFKFAALGLCAPFLLSPLLLSMGTVQAAAATAARTYDCTKAGNANKAACKGVTPTAAAPAAASTPMASAVHPATAPARPQPQAQAASPAAASAPAAAPHATTASASGGRIVEWTTKTGKVVHYDCSKAGNFNKQACKQ